MSGLFYTTARMRLTLSLTLLATLHSTCRSKRGDDAGSDAQVAARPVSQAVTLNDNETDGWKIVGTLTTGAANQTGAVLFVHQLGSNRAEWAPLVARLQQGVAVTTLAIDLRGHGASTRRGASTEEQTWESFGTDRERWESTTHDVTAALRYLRAGGATDVVIIGSSIGASAAIQAAAETQAAAVVMLSPGLGYHGFDTRPAMQQYARSGRPVLLLAGDQDEPAAEAVPVLASMAGTNATYEVFGASREHGVSLCNAVPARWDRIEAWVRGVLRVPLRGAGAGGRDGGRGPVAAPGGRN